MNVVDLDTNDSGIRSEIFSVLSRPDSDIILVHALGLDHAIHTFNIHHSEMDRKMRDTDALLKDIFSAMDDNTTMVLLGDHGTIDQGNHGGETPEEKSTVLFMTSKGQKLRVGLDNYSKV